MTNVTSDSVSTLCPGASSSLASGYSSQTSSLTQLKSEQRLTESRSEKNLLSVEKPRVEPQMSVSLEDVKICEEEKTPDTAFTPSPAVKSPQWSRTKEIYTTGLYAHWWLNASLQPISEENLSDKLTENL